MLSSLQTYQVFYTPQKIRSDVLSVPQKVVYLQSRVKLILVWHVMSVWYKHTRYDMTLPQRRNN